MSRICSTSATLRSVTKPSGSGGGGFGPMLAAEIRNRRIEGMRSSRWRWHLDEVFVQINGKTHYLLRAVDHEGEVLESFVTKTRDKRFALKFLKKALRKHGRSDALVTDKLRSHGAAVNEIGAADRQETGCWLNNRAENSYRPFRRRERAMLRISAHARSAKIRVRPCLRLQPFQPGTRRLEPGDFQGQPRRPSYRVARSLRGIREGPSALTETSLNWSDSTRSSDARTTAQRDQKA